MLVTRTIPVTQPYFKNTLMDASRQHALFLALQRSQEALAVYTPSSLWCTLLFYWQSTVFSYNCATSRQNLHLCTLDV